MKKSNGIKDILDEKYGRNNREMIKNINTLLHWVSGDLNSIDTWIVPKPEQISDDYIIPVDAVLLRK